jgi:glycosyltransferase involved in cell wall biosynthesis
MTSGVDVSGELRLSIVIAVLNEESNLAALIDEINSVCDAHRWAREIIVVDDGSTDNSARVAGSMANVTVFRFRRNFGQTAAFDAGCHAAQYEYIVTMDGDGQNDPADIPNLITHLQAENLDVVSGWRVNREDSFSKRFISRGANLLRKMFLNDAIHDSGCSLKVYRRECFDNVRLYGEMHRFIPALLEMRGFSVGELAVNDRPRRSGKSKYNALRTIKGSADIVLLWFWRSYSVRPIHLLGGIGVLFFLAATMFGGRTIYLFVMDRKLSSTLEPLLTVFCFIAGLLFVSLGILTDILIKIYYAISAERYYSVREIIKNGSVMEVADLPKNSSERRSECEPTDTP